MVVIPSRVSDVQLGELVLHQQKSIALVNVLVRSRPGGTQWVRTVDVTRRRPDVERSVVGRVVVVLVLGWAWDGRGVVDLGRDRGRMQHLRWERAWNVGRAVVDLMRRQGRQRPSWRTDGRAPVGVTHQLRR